MILTRRDEDIVMTLTWKGRCVDSEQLAASWWTPTRGGRAEAGRRARRLVEAGLLREFTVLRRPLPPLDAPVIVGVPESLPDVDRAAHIFQRRWSKPPRMTAVYLATPKAAALTGGSAPGLKHPLQASHDLAVVQVYLNLKRRHPAVAESWIGEDCAPWPRGLRVRRADAIIRQTTGEVASAIEIGGSGSAYGPDRLRALHEHFAAQGIPYFVW